MVKKVIVIFCLCNFYIATQFLKAQIYSDQENPWILGFGFNIIYDSGDRFNGLLNVKENYHFRTPLRVSIEKRINLDYGIEISANYNKLLEGKTFNGSRLTQDIDFFAIDGMLKYYFTNLFLDKYRSSFEGSVIGGFGNNFYDSKWGLSVNLGIGASYYITDDFLITSQGILKFSIVDPLDVRDFLHFNIGFLIKL